MKEIACHVITYVCEKDDAVGCRPQDRSHGLHSRTGLHGGFPGVFLFCGVSPHPRPSQERRRFTLLAAGIPFWLTSVATVMRAYKTRRLCTSGPFALCRHPVYASWVVFILPGISLLLDSWLFLLSPLVLYAAVVKSAPEEERYLEDLFGDEYRVYQERVPMVLPLGSPGRGK